MTVEPFRIEVEQGVLDDLRERLSRTRYSPSRVEKDWALGTETSYLRELCTYWREHYNWREHETRLNRLHHFKTELSGTKLHFVHERGKGPNAVPILLIHGWPDSFLRFEKLIPLLTEPAGPHGLCFDVVVPSIPGYGFTELVEGTSTFDFPGMFHELMQGLGYERYAVQGGDWGGTLAEELLHHHGRSLLGVHLTDVPFGHLMEQHADLTSAEQKFVDGKQEWMPREGAYSLLQSSKPRSLAAGLNDSPAGLAAWMSEKYRTWSDSHGQLETRFSKDELLTGITLYWVTETIESSFMTYYDRVHAGALRWSFEKLKTWLGSSSTPVALALFPADLGTPPREWAERFFHVKRWTPMPRGGHFAAFEEPKLLAEDLRGFFAELGLGGAKSS